MVSRDMANDEALSGGIPAAPVAGPNESPICDHEWESRGCHYTPEGVVRSCAIECQKCGEMRCSYDDRCSHICRAKREALNAEVKLQRAMTAGGVDTMSGFTVSEIVAWLRNQATAEAAAILRRNGF